MLHHPDLLETLRHAQRFGFFGARPIEEAIAHSRSFVEALTALGQPDRLVDLGSGGGLPGLVLADVFRSCTIVLVDRRQKRTDFLSRAISALGFEHVSIMAADVEHLSRDVDSGVVEPFDAVTARGFGPPEVTLGYGRRLMRADGAIIISEPPTGDRWAPGLLERLGLDSHTHGAVRVFRSSGLT